MRKMVLSIGSLVTLACSLGGQTDPYMTLAKKVLRSTPLIDGHNDLPWRIREDSVFALDVIGYDLRRTTAGHTDFDRLGRGMVGGQFWSVFVPGDIKDSGFARVQLEQIDIARRVIERYPDKLRFCTTAACLRESFASGRIGSMLGMEGGHAIENSLGVLRAYHALGVRYMTLTHNVTLDWADAAVDDSRHDGLTKFGEEVVREMNRLGMIVDLSHVSPAAMSDALNVAVAPVIFSHSSARAVADHPRNVPDSILTRVAKNGGVVMVTFVPAFVSPKVAERSKARAAKRKELVKRFGQDTASVTKEMAAWNRANPAPKVTLAQVVDHLDHIRKLIGADHVGIGADFDGIDETIVGLEDVSTYPTLFAALARRGWSENELEKLAGKNVLRVIEEVERVAARLSKERPPSIKTIRQLDGKGAKGR